MRKETVFTIGYMKGTAIGGVFGFMLAVVLAITRYGGKRIDWIALAVYCVIMTALAVYLKIEDRA